jgi:pimeloyl-ACP methyl ester carboxylesterase
MMVVNLGENPPVVFISQLGTGGDSWKPVIELLTCASTTVTYDRPGTGDAPPRPAPNPPLPYCIFADELADLLDQHGITEPSVLVGHSIGSLILRVFAGRYPERTAGMVHVDGSIPRRRLIPAFDDVQLPDGDEPDATEIATLTGEVEALDSEAFWPDIPSVVLTRTLDRWTHGYIAEQADPIWSAYQRQLARLCHCPLILAEDAGHQIPAEAPALVAHLVDEIVAAARVGERWTPDPIALAAAGGRMIDASPRSRRRSR